MTDCDIKKDIKEYIKAHEENKITRVLPLVFFSKRHLDIAIKFFKEEYTYYDIFCNDWLEEPICIKDEEMHIVEQENIIVDCKHYPYKCGEFKNPKFEGNVTIQQNYTTRDNDCCKCSCYCYHKDLCNENFNVASYTYLEPYDGTEPDDLIIRCNNCYQGCCAFYEIKKRYLLTIIFIESI